MRQGYFMLLLVLLNIQCFGKNIPLKKNREKENVVLLNYGYTIYFSLTDIKNALKSFPEERRNANLSLMNSLVTKDPIDLNTKAGTPMANIFTEEIGAFLLLHGKAFVEDTHKKRVASITPHEAPVTKRLDGTSYSSIEFTVSGTENDVFMGNVSSDLRNK